MSSTPSPHVRAAAGLLAITLLAAPIAAGAQTRPPPAGPLSVTPGSAYAHAKQGCWGRGDRLKLVGAQTDDAQLATNGVSITSVCVGPARAAARATAPRPRPVNRHVKKRPER